MSGMNRGFTVVELLVSMAIFVTMTSVIVAKYGSFNQSTLLTNTAYDVALVVRLAQTYGLSVKSTTQTGTPNFSLPYGVDFNEGQTSLVLFADSDPTNAPNGLYGVSDAVINTYQIIRGAKILSLCVGIDADNCHDLDNSVSKLDVSFLRPNPEAKICGTFVGGQVDCTTYSYAEVVISSTDDSTRTIVIRQNGQISVQR